MDTKHRILDEALTALSLKLLPQEALLDFLKETGAGTEIVLTGRRAPEAVMELADYVSEIRSLKHPFTRSVSARKGTEY